MKKIVTILVFILFASEMLSINRYVTNTNDSGLGSLRQVVGLAGPSDVIYFNSNLIANGSDTIKLNSTISITNNFNIKGLNNATDTLYISGQKLTRVFSASSTCKYLIMDNIYIINGNGRTAFQNGGALSFLGENIIITNSNFVGNEGYNGGSIYISTRGNVTNFKIKNIKIKNSIASESGGGIYVLAGGISNIAFEFFNNIISKNRCLNGDGGGMNSQFFSDSSSINIKNCIFNLNQSQDNGGGLFLENIHTGQPNFFRTDIYNSKIFQNNAGGYGGGIYTNEFLKNNETNIKDSKIFQNKSVSDGGGIYSLVFVNGISGFNIINTTIDSNISTSGSGGGLYLQCGNANTPSLYNSTISNNKAKDNGGGVYFASSYNYSQNVLSIINVTLFNNKVTNQFFSSPQAGGLYILSNSNSAFKINNSTIFQNDKYGVYNSSSGSSILSFKNSIFHSNLQQSFYSSRYSSQGFNIFEESSIPNSLSSDSLGISLSSLSLGVLSNNGGPSKTLLPGISSIAVNNGTLFDTTEAQNGPVIDGRRDIGACENGAGNYVSLKEEMKITSIKVKLYPNPTINYSNIEFEKEYKNIEIKLLDITGKEIAFYKVKKKQSFKLITSNLIKGSYFVRLSLDNEIKVMKLTKI